MTRKQLRKLMKERLPTNYSGYIYDTDPTVVVKDRVGLIHRLAEIVNVYWDNTDHCLVIEVRPDE